MKINFTIIISIILCVSSCAQRPAMNVDHVSSKNTNEQTAMNNDQRPSLTLTQEGVKKVRAGLGTAPKFDQQLALVREKVEQAMLKGIDVPVPKDMAGGYTHEQHKVNYKLMQMSGNLYQFTGEEKYAKFVKDMLMEYAKMYPTLSLHHTMKSYATGKIFWQCLNDANWLVFTSQAYDCIYNYLSQEEREHLEKDLFIPFAEFLSVENPRFFNRIHNHSTWANAAVGLIALAMNNDELLERALYGLKDDGINPEELDNDGGYIKRDGIYQAGFLAQLDYSFSPEGYFSEGPYYQRYAIFPFLVFSHALHNKKPELKIFEYRDGILKKATNSLLELTDPQGQFFPINDSQKGMSFNAYEIVTAVNLMYNVDNTQTRLLDWAAEQDNVAFNESGFFVAQKLKEVKTKRPVKESMIFGDGVDGTEGGISVLRIGDTDLLFKFSAHGMGHGHFDRLSYAMYDKQGEVVQDYGAVRWVNVDQKGGGRYLPENKTFGKQTIGHNTVVVNQKSQFDAKVKKADKVAPEKYLYDATNPQLKIISAIEENAYDNVSQHRTLMLFQDEDFVEPLVIDLFSINANQSNTYDLPLWFKGHHMKTSFDCNKQLDGLNAMGGDDGYQHIWQESLCEVEDDSFQFTWFGNSRFYTLNGCSSKGDKIIKGRAGANDPNFNLRPDPVMIHRKVGSDVIYFNILESHGEYSRITEIPTRPFGQIENLSILRADEKYTICTFSNAMNVWTIYFSNSDNNAESMHEVTVGDIQHSWKGPYKIKKSNKK